jgi:hypothetical protein
MRRAADHAMLMLHRAVSERDYARTKNLRDLTEVVQNDKEAKKVIKNLRVEAPVRKGIPIGQRWD